MTLSALCHAFSHRPSRVHGEQTIRSLCIDSRTAQAGDCFFCLCGAHCDGHHFARDAYARGVRVFVCERPLPLPDDALCLQVENAHRAYALACGVYFGTAYPFTLIGITGTKGKTTVANYLYRILEQSGKRVGLIFTGGIRFGDQITPTPNTTPEAFTLHRALADFAKRGAQYVILEVSSQAYLRHRVDALTFDLGIFTNLSYDHTGRGEHESFSDYLRCKQLLFQNSHRAVLNRDDPHFADFARACACPFVTYSTLCEADYRAQSICPLLGQDFFGVRFLFHTNAQTLRFQLRLPGVHNVQNALAALAAAQELGIGSDVFFSALSTDVGGRCERIRLSCGADAVIDYAHNEASLAAALRALSPFVRGRLFCLFGSVGGRTQGRRIGMGRVAATLCDYAILTADNPDFEDPVAICAEIASAFPPSFPYAILCDRAEAIRFALDKLRKGDLLLLCGKGTERSQRILGREIPFCEREIIQAWEKDRLF